MRKCLKSTVQNRYVYNFISRATKLREKFSNFVPRHEKCITAKYNFGARSSLLARRELIYETRQFFNFILTTTRLFVVNQRYYFLMNARIKILKALSLPLSGTLCQNL